MADQILHTRPIDPLLSVEQLENARVIYRYFRDQEFSHHAAIGVIKEVKLSRHFGWMARIIPDAGQGVDTMATWFSLGAVLGYAWYTEPDAAPITVAVPVARWTPVTVLMLPATTQRATA